MPVWRRREQPVRGPRREHAEPGAATVPPATGLPGGRWLVLGKDGRLTAYARADGGLLRWTELRAGGPAWSRPEFVPAPHLTHLTVVQGADTYVHLLGRRERPRAQGGAQVDIVHAIQYQTGRAVTEWRSLGTPYRDPANAARFGAPCGAVDSGGAVYVFARNAGNGLTMRRESPSGKWERWTDLRGRQVVEGAAAVGLSTGRVEVLAPAGSAALHWSQAEPGGPLQRMPDIPQAPKAGSVVAVETGPGRVTYYWTDQAGSGLVAHRPGEWWGGIGGAPADSPVSVVRAVIDGHDCTVLAHTALDGQVMLAACGTENEGAGLWWSPTGEECVGAPGLAVDGLGRVVLAVVGKDGDLRIARRRPEPGLALGPAARV